MQTQQTRIDLLKARDYLLEHGWCRGALQSYDGMVCLDGAVRMAIFGTIDTGPHQPEPLRVRYRAAWGKVHNTLAPVHYSPHVWNDQPERELDDVLDLLTRAANS